MSIRITLTLCLMLCPPGTAVPTTATAPGDVQSAESIVETLRGADSPEALVDAYGRFKNILATDQLSRLVADPRSDVAYAAAWERVRRTVPANKEDGEITPDKRELWRFLGVVEGRTQVPLPPTWEKAVKLAVCNSRREFWFSTPEIEAAFRGDRPWPEPRGQVKCEKDECVVTFQSSTWAVPADNAGPADVSTVSRVKKGVYIAIYGWPPMPYPLYALDENGRILWVTRVWARFPIAAGGMGWHDVDLRVRGEELIVFGLSEGTAYIEAFCTKTGKNLYRFGSAYFQPAE